MLYRNMKGIAINFATSVYYLSTQYLDLVKQRAGAMCLFSNKTSQREGRNILMF